VTFTAVKGDTIVEGATIGYTDSRSATGIVKFVAKDAAGNVVSDASMNTRGKFYAISSDSGVLSDGQALKGNYVECSVLTASTGTWACSMWAIDSGTATITIGDSITVASSNYVSSAISVTVAGAARTGTIKADKTTYAPGERQSSP